MTSVHETATAPLEEFVALQQSARDVVRQIGTRTTIDGTAIPDFVTLLSRLDGAKQPDRDATVDGAIFTLDNEAQCSYSEGLSNSQVWRRAYPADIPDVCSEAASPGLNVLTVRRFSKDLQDKGHQHGASIYSLMREESRDEVISELTELSEGKPAELVVDKTDVDQAFDDTLIALTDRIHEAGRNIVSGYAAKGLMRLVGGAPKSYQPKHKNTTANINNHLDDLNTDLTAFIDSPWIYIQEQIVGQLIEKYAQQGARFADEDVRELVIEKLEELDTKLRTYVRAATIGHTATDTVQGEITPDEEIATTPQATSPPDHTNYGRLVLLQDPDEIYEIEHAELEQELTDVELTLPWLERDDTTRTLHRYTTDHGEDILWIDARSEDCLKLEQRIADDNEHVASGFKRLSNQLIRLAATGNFERRTKVLNPNRFSGLKIRYNRNNGQNAQRSFATLTTLDSVIDETTLAGLMLTWGYTGDKQVLLLLGNCNKNTEGEMLSRFIDTDRYTLQVTDTPSRARVGGSFRRRSY